MAVEANTVTSLFDTLKIDDPWIPPKPWESIPSESGNFSSESKSQSSYSLYHISALSESSLVRLAMNALQGVESALITVDKLSGLFCSDSADRTFHRISNLWTRSSSTHALGNLLKSVGQFGSIIFLLHKFISYFMHLNPDANSEEENLGKDSSESNELPKCNLSIVNQAFAVAVKKVLDGYISALNTLYASVSMRRDSKNDNGGCLMDIGNAEVTLLEVYLHTKGLRIQMEALGNICHISDIALGFPVSSFEALIVKANVVFVEFPRGGSLLTFLYMQLKVIDPIHSALSKFLFLQSCEPYFGFIRSWIYEGRISDPYEEFVVEYVEDLPPYAVGNSGISIDFPLKAVRVRDGIKLPCFLEEFLIPLLRAGQQLQVVVKLLELCNNLGTCKTTHEQILPFLEDIPSEYPIFASGLTFQRGNIENLALARKSYYERLQGKVESILAKFEFRSHQASVHNIQLLYAMNHGRNLKHHSLVDDILIPNVINGRDENREITTSDHEVSEDESLSAEDFLESSESASLDGFEEQNESEVVCYSKRGLEPNYFSSLCFSLSSHAHQLAQKPSLSHLVDSYSSEMCERKRDDCQGIGSYHERADLIYGSLPYQFEESNLFSADDTDCKDDQHEVNLPFGWIPDDHSYVDGGNGRLAWPDLTSSQLKVKKKILDVLKTDVSSSSDSIYSGIISQDRASHKNEHSDAIRAFPNASDEYSWGSKYNCKFLSTNPILSKSYFFNYSNMSRESSSMNYREALPNFDFTSIRDPRIVCEEKLASGPRKQIGAEFSTVAHMADGDCANVSGYQSKEGGCSYENSKKKAISTGFYICSNSKAENWEDNSHGDITGGSGWATMLACFHKTSGLTTKGYRNISAEVFEMPLDYVIKKCLWEQILFQYKYVSKLTIKLLEEGFDLQEHLLALRRYHFMELADWADLFILSLWHHKWHMVDADKRIPEIQGVLESSVQRSSCEGDPNKDRLYIYMKRDFVLSTSANGVHSFDFLGLGYRVEWPVTIILTPDALKKYSNIFNFLIQVKLAVFSLSDTWRLLKDLVQLTKHNRRSELPKLAVHHICLLTETRLQINHFVSALQQYVQSQLSHVSWCKFLDSLKHKVKDMMDLEAVHVAYLTESLQICFLSDETAPIAAIIRSILQIAIDFQSCLVWHSHKVGPSGEDSFSELSQIDIAQVIAIKKTFMKDLKELYICYHKSPKHAEYGVSHFWDYLDCNGYYSEILDKEFGLHVLPLSLQAMV